MEVWGDKEGVWDREARKGEERGREGKKRRVSRKPSFTKRSEVCHTLLTVLIK